MDNKTWTLINRPINKLVVISSKWIYKCKYNSNGIIAWYKACFVAWCFNQIVGKNYEIKLSIVIQFISLCVLIGLSAINNYHIHQMDVTIFFYMAIWEK
jgi:hypothetical protein